VSRPENGVTVVCDGQVVTAANGERLLDALLRAGLRVPSSCRAGACQSCMVKATRGTPPVAAQAGLKETLRAQGFFLACSAELREDLEITLEGTKALAVPAQISAVERLSADVLRVTVRPALPFPHRGGQWLTLLRDDGLARPYSIASVPGSDARGMDAIELHVRVLPHGRMSGWLAGSEALGASVQLRGPAGDCFYTGGNLAQPLLLAGTGTGLAPLWAVAREALRAGHAGPIHLWHGARNRDGLYLVEEIRALARHHRQLEYHPCVLDGGETDVDVARGRLDEIVLKGAALAGSRLFLCGDPKFVATVKRGAFLGGAALRDIHADAFVTAPPSD
jgi:CDP-4-dehydro-6-deoxyglucose reductase